MTTGRTVGKFSKFQISDSASTLRDIPVTSYGNVGLTYEEQDVTALQDAIKKVFNGQGAMDGITISGPFDNSSAVAASTTGARPALSGSHTVLSALVGGTEPKTFGIYLGIQGDWAAGNPVFGAEKCCIVTSYTVDPAARTYSAKIAAAGNRHEDPAWGTAQLDATTA